MVFLYGHRFRLLHWAVEQAMTNALAQMDLTAAQGQIIRYLARRDTPPCPKDVEETFHLSHPTVSGLLARLEKKGFISLVPDPTDRRCKRIYLLPKGRDCDDTIHQIILKTEELLVKDFSPEDREQFAQLLDRAVQNMGADRCFEKSGNSGTP